MDRHARQARLAGIGAEGQGRIARVEVAVRSRGFAAEVAARYLAGAGVRRLHVPDAAAAAAASAVDPAVEVVSGNSQGGGETGRNEWRPTQTSPPPHPPVPIPESELRDPVARDLAQGAYEALMLLRAALEEVAS